MKRFLLVACLASRLGAQTLGASVSTLPSTGVDFTGIDAFYRIAGILVKGGEPSVEQWRALHSTPGYRLFTRESGNVRQMLVSALSPSKKSERDAILRSDSDAARGMRHIIRAWEQRSAVLLTYDVLQRTIRDSVVRSLQLAAQYLPKGLVDQGPPPFIGFAIFGDDGYAVDGGVLLDPLFVKEEGLIALLAHEFHHIFTSTLDRTIRPQFGATPPADATLALPLIHLRNEGIADLIDKPYPLPERAGALAWYPPRYNDVYARSPQIIRSLDSLLVVVRGDSAMVGPAATIARRMLWSNSHPTGAYMARTIFETFGTDSLLPGLYNPFAFLRAFSAAEVKRGKPAAWSPSALEMLADMERRYIAR
jgi:hypothetical protein